MVFQAIRDVLTGVTPATYDDLSRGRKVLFLRDIRTGYPTMSAGRLGWVDDMRDGRIRVLNARRDLSQWVDPNWIAVVNPSVNVGASVLVADDPVRSYSPLIGSVGTVTAVDGTAIWVDSDASGNRARLTSNWVLAGPPVPAVPLTEEQLAISQWWVDRIVAEAKAEGKRRSWCSELDAVLKRIFEPLPKAIFKSEDLEDTDGGKKYQVLDPKGEPVAIFTDAQDAAEYVRTKNNNLEVKYMGTLPAN